MIEGLKVTIPGHRLRSLCFAAADKHESRAQTYRDQIANFEAAKVEAASFSGGDPIQALQRKLSEHADEAAELTFIADNLDAEASYLLDRGDLKKLGICKNAY
jgi:hypothetical protein